MATERTLSIIKPDATRRNLTGKINACLEEAGLRIVAQKRLHLTQAQAEAFYAVHKSAAVLPRPGHLHDLRPGGGAGAGRRERGRPQPRGDGRDRPEKGRCRHHPRASSPRDIEANSVHGSDSAENAATEIAFFFAGIEIVG